MDANGLRRAWLDFFAAKDHTRVASSGLIPTHPTAPLFTNAGMNQFVPYFLGEEPAPYPRATSVQKCVRTADIDIVGTTTRHCTFFEMLGNFSFGDYFKERAIPLAWELATTVLGYDGDRLWATVHTSDDEGEQIWRDVVGLDRVQRLGDEDNFWEMQKGGTGPCGPNSELFLDRGPSYGPDGGPANDTEGERYLEFWNLVFIQYNRQPDQSLVPLPRPGVDTGAGFERNLCLLQDVDWVFETDVYRPILDRAQSLTGRRYRDDPKTDVSLRIMADHARSSAFLVSDGVPPSNDERGYVVRRLIRRMVRHAYQLGVDRPVTPELLEAVGESMGEAYPDLMKSLDAVTGVISREEDRFRTTLRSGSLLLDEELATGRVAGETAFKLHDTFGFPIELTEEIAAERGVEVDRAGFDTAMAEQRQRAKAGRKVGALAGGSTDRYLEILNESGTTEFTGYAECESKGRIVAILDAGEGRLEVFLDRTPFYAEGGGQVGDTGTIFTDTGTLRVLDTTYALPGLHRHLCEPVDGEVEPDQEALAVIDIERREAIRRNHTGTHLLHWALREVLGAHVKQQGSLVAPDYLRFDFSHHQPVSDEEMERIEELVNGRVLDNEPVRAYETSKEHAAEIGAIAFFGDKYGDIVRVVEAGDRSMELCGGTHVSALGMIGPIKVTTEQSIGSNMRRIFALTGAGSLEHFRHEEEVLERAATLLRTKPEELPDAVERVLARQKSLEDELKALRSQLARGESRTLAATAENGWVVARFDGLAADQLKDLAVAVREEPEVRGVVIVGSPDGERVALVASVEKGVSPTAPELIAPAAKLVGGGGGGKNAELAQAGGRDVTKIDEALSDVRSRLGLKN
jgi:alanyl-tRNA synthetase